MSRGDSEVYKGGTVWATWKVVCRVLKDTRFAYKDATNATLRQKSGRWRRKRRCPTGSATVDTN